MQYHARSVKGRREKNEDSFIATKLHEDVYIFAVADGVGGLADGDQASKHAITILSNQLQKNLALKQAMQTIHQQLLTENNNREAPMATTLTACLINISSEKAQFAHLGDSQAIMFDDCQPLWRTKNHTVVQELVELGIITDFQAKHHPERHRLKQAIGISSNPSFQFQTKSIQNITILLCTDGISDYVTLEKIQNIVTNHPAEHACTHLISKAKHHKSPDDMTAIVIQHK